MKNRNLFQNTNMKTSFYWKTLIVMAELIKLFLNGINIVSIISFVKHMNQTLPSFLEDREKGETRKLEY